MSKATYSINIGSSGKELVSASHYDIYPNEITFMFGESGIGKSLLSKAVYGILDGDGLEVTINDQDYSNHSKSSWALGVQESSFFVFQEPSSHLNPLLKISAQLSEGSLSAPVDMADILRHLWDTNNPESVNKVLDVFPKPFRPSGGEKQRSILAMAFKKIALFQKSDQTTTSTFFVFDEPTGSLDNHYRNLFIKLLFHEYTRKPFTILIITHDYSIISEIFNSYKQLIPKVRFLELSRISGVKTDLRDFSPDEYLGWLSSVKQSNRVSCEKEEVLRFNSLFSVFNRSMAVYKDEKHKVPADLVIHKGETVYVKAQSGVGKTTLAKIIMGLYNADRFSMNLCNTEMSEKSPKKIWDNVIWGKKAGMVFQHADEALDLQATVYETFVGLPLKAKPDRLFVRDRLKELFQGEIIEDFLDKKVAFLSGGQKQRLNLLRTLILDTDLIILDEPLNGLDFLSIKKVLALIEDKRRSGKAILMISHNEEIFDNIVNMDSVFYLGSV